MDKDKDVKPAEIQDEELNEVQGGIRALSPSIRVPETTTLSDAKVNEYQDGDDLILRKRPGRIKYGDVTLK